MPMLTDRALRNLKPGDMPLSDSQVPGLMIRPNANGGKWALRLRRCATPERVRWQCAARSMVAMTPSRSAYASR
ncbi:hypothetical protein AB3X91_23380 [Paraburkholderia sp. BR14263]|uniref:hypothetical protein n=1 Tax=unclassified Paraburkholderia TaxID=2615204 RepID=UPI0034CF6FE6